MVDQLSPFSVGSPVEFIPGLLGEKSNEKNNPNWTYINGRKWQREMLDSVYNFRLAEMGQLTLKIDATSG